MAAAVQPERILKDLAKLWVDLGKEDSQKGSAGVLRACAMTLIAAVEEEADAASVSETLAELMHQHPSRAIVLRVCQEKESALDARVFAQCWMPFGGRQQICCEQIEITAPPSQLDDLPKLVLGLTVPDLPVVLWCRSQRLAGDPSFQQLFPLVSKIIVDTDTPAEPRTLGSGFAFVRNLNAQGRIVADLAWTRLTRWRESVAQIFDNEQAREHMNEIVTVSISHAEPEAKEPLPSRLAYLAAWFKRSLPSKFEIVFRTTETEPGRMVQAIALRGNGFNASVELEGTASAVIRFNDLTRRVPFPQLTGYELLREELSILGPDPVFQRCLE